MECTSQHKLLIVHAIENMLNKEKSVRIKRESMEIEKSNTKEESRIKVVVAVVSKTVTSFKERITSSCKESLWLDKKTS